MKTDNNTRWMSSQCLRAAPSGEVNHEQGIIEGVSVCTVGEAKGHGVNLDSEFVSRIVALGAEKRQGIKARFGHPNMCSTALGTFIGRFKNFRQVGTQAKADLFLSNEAKETPHGNLYDYVLGMANNEPDMFGTSIVFTPGRLYQRDEDGNKEIIVDEFAADPLRPLFVECQSLHACDAVDEPAANDGLFSRFANETIAGQVTEFLDLNPDIWDAISTNPSIVEALARYGNKMDEFITRYREYRSNSTEVTMTDETREEVAETTEAAVEELEATETPEEQEEQEAEETQETAETEEPAETATEEEETTEPEAMSREQFVAVADEFGDDVAAQVMRDGGTAADAVRIAYGRVKDENEKLRERVAELEKVKLGGKAAKVDEARDTKPLIRIK